MSHKNHWTGEEGRVAVGGSAVLIWWRILYRPVYVALDFFAPHGFLVMFSPGTGTVPNPPDSQSRTFSESIPTSWLACVTCPWHWERCCCCSPTVQSSMTMKSENSTDTQISADRSKMVIRSKVRIRQGSEANARTLKNPCRHRAQRDPGWLAGLNPEPSYCEATGNRPCQKAHTCRCITYIRF